MEYLNQELFRDSNKSPTRNKSSHRNNKIKRPSRRMKSKLLKKNNILNEKEQGKIAEGRKIRSRIYSKQYRERKKEQVKQLEQLIIELQEKNNYLFTMLIIQNTQNEQLRCLLDRAMKGEKVIPPQDQHRLVMNWQNDVYKIAIPRVFNGYLDKKYKNVILKKN